MSSQDPAKDESSSLEPSKAEGGAGDPMERAIEALKPALTQLSVGGVMGYCSGMALKKVGKVLATVIGLGFVAVQSAAYAGYIQVNWAKIGNDSIVKPLDSSGDGKLDLEDVKLWWRKVKKILTHQLPDATGFSMGFLLGVKYG